MTQPAVRLMCYELPKSNGAGGGLSEAKNKNRLKQKTSRTFFELENEKKCFLKIIFYSSKKPNRKQFQTRFPPKARLYIPAA